MRRSRLALLAAALPSLAACAAAPVAPAVPPAPPPAAVAPPSPAVTTPDPWRLPPRAAPVVVAPRPAGRIALDAYRAVKGVPAAPASCAAYVRRAAATPAPRSIDDALAEPAADRRDALLVALAPAPEALVVRADVAPVDCADAIVEPALAGRSHVEGTAEHALVGLALAAKLARTAKGAPTMPAGADKARVKAFVKGPLKKWMLEQASAIEALSLAGRELVGYGRGVAAIEAGTADLRLVDTIRSSPVPKEWDAELRQLYEIALDEALEPRKARGRDAALVGLGELARAGAVDDARVGRARTLLAKLYGGRRIDALDGLLVPGTVQAGPGSSYWRGTQLAAGTRKASPREHFEAGRLFWERSELVEAAYGLADATSPDERLLLALSLALASGPANAGEMMRGPFALSHTEALDALVTERGANAGAAAYDAAHLRSLATMGAAGATPLADVAARFERAAELLTDPTQKALARERAVETRAAIDAGRAAADRAATAP